MRLEVAVVSWRGNFCKLRGTASVNGDLAAEATLMCKMIDRVLTVQAEKTAK